MKYLIANRFRYEIIGIPPINYTVVITKWPRPNRTFP